MRGKRLPNLLLYSLPLILNLPSIRNDIKDGVKSLVDFQPNGRLIEKLCATLSDKEVLCRYITIPFLNFRQVTSKLETAEIKAGHLLFHTIFMGVHVDDYDIKVETLLPFYKVSI